MKCFSLNHKFWCLDIWCTCLVELYQDISNYVPGVTISLVPKFTCFYIAIFKINLTNLHLWNNISWSFVIWCVAFYQGCSNYVPGVKYFWSTSFLNYGQMSNVSYQLWNVPLMENWVMTIFKAIRQIEKICTYYFKRIHNF